MKKLLLSFALITLLIGFGVPAFAVPTGFSCISNNSAANCASGVAQLNYDVFPSGSGTELLINNPGSTPMIVDAIYLDDRNGSLTGLFSGFVPTGLVNFGVGGSPPILPAGNNAIPPFIADQHWTRLTGRGHNVNDGINPFESLGLVFSPSSFFDVFTDLNDGDLRLGIHVQAFANGGSESFVSLNQPTNCDITPTAPGCGSGGGGGSPVPEPGTVMLMGSGLIGLLFLGRYRSNQI